jgi:chlorobactene glucosyltransferase
MILFLLLSIPVFISLIVVIYNLITETVFKEIQCLNDERSLISVLIPARDEEHNILKCLESVINQSYKDIEILILDDNSSDKTASIIKKFSGRYNNVVLINGKPLPENMSGKNWACSQLAEKANGKYFLFIDADVNISPTVVQTSLNYFYKNNIDVLSVFPTQIISSLGEWLIVPLMNWLLLSFLPLRLIYKSDNISLTAANGQFIMWKKEAYIKTGSHIVASTELVEDMFMAKQAKLKGFKLITLLGGNLVFCKMYDSLSSAIEGFSKNFYPGFKIEVISFTVLILFLFGINILPFIFIIFSPLFYITCIAIFLIRILISYLSKQNVLYNLLLHPIQMVMMLITGVNSLISFHNKSITWKGRKVLL